MSDEERCYDIIRMFASDKDSYVVRRRVTLAEAQAHCHDPETSSSTCTSAEGKRRTRKYGAWFDGYELR
jgi:hypothetical protein